MILVFASIFNKAAASFVSNYKGVAASLITCSSLSLTETHISYPEVDGSYITVDDTRLYLKDVKGIINLLPGILPEEMYFYNETEYAYQAQEFTALLAFMLNVLDVPVINKPYPHNLSGKISNAFEWNHLATALHIPHRDMDSNNDTLEESRRQPSGVITITYSNGQIWPLNAHPLAAEYTSKLAEQAESSFLTAVFSAEGFVFLHATTIPDINQPEISNLLFQAFKDKNLNESISLGSITRPSHTIGV